MAVDMQMLAWSVVLGLVQMLIAATASVGQRGLNWAASSHDGNPIVLTGMAGRLDRASANCLETFVFFAALALAGDVQQRHSAITVLGAQLSLGTRGLRARLCAGHSLFEDADLGREHRRHRDAARYAVVTD